MNSHELAKLLLRAEDGPICCSVDISTCEEDALRRVHGDFTEVNCTPSAQGFGGNEVVLLFEGSIND